MKNIFRKVISFVGWASLMVAAPIGGATQVASPFLSTVLHMIAGLGIIPTAVSSLPDPWLKPVGHLIGRAISFIGRRLNPKWEELEDQIQAALPNGILLIQYIAEGMDLDDSETI